MIATMKREKRGAARDELLATDGNVGYSHLAGAE
jgi:hypothetical protein